jgi:hypothetical protein
MVAWRSQGFSNNTMTTEAGEANAMCIQLLVFIDLMKLYMYIESDRQHGLKNKPITLITISQIRHDPVPKRPDAMQCDVKSKGISRTVNSVTALRRVH